MTPSVPPPPPIPVPPTMADASIAPKKRPGVGGAGASVLTSGLGDLSSPNTNRKTLLGQ